MNQKARYFIVVIMLLPFFLVVALLFGGKRDTAPNTYRYIVGFVETQTEDSGKAQINEMVKTVCDSKAYQLLSVPTERTQDAQIEAVRALIAYQVDVIVLSPVVDRGFSNVLKEAQAANIPVLLLDKGISEIPVECDVSYVGFDYYGGAHALAEHYIAREEADAVLLELFGTVGGSSSLQITKGFRQTLRAQTVEKDGRITYSVSEEFLQSHAQQAMQRYLRADAGLNAVFSHGDAMTLGAVDAVRLSGLQPGADVRIYAMGGSEETRALLKTGELSALAYCDNVKLTVAFRDTLAQILRGDEHNLESIIDVPVLEGGVAT